MRIVIAGAGKGGLSVATHLRAQGHAVTVVDRDRTIISRAFEQHGLVALLGDATEPSILREAGVPQAEVVMAMLGRDADNLAVAQLARAFGAGRVMVRVRDIEYQPVYEAAGVDRMVLESGVLMAAFGIAIEHPAVRHGMMVGKGNSVAFELDIPEDAAVVGRTVSAIASDPKFPRSCVLAGLTDAEGGFEAPRGASVIQAGVTILLVAPRQEIGSTSAFFLRRK
jgi:trk system potassium uptake protein TrkA